MPYRRYLWIRFNDDTTEEDSTSKIYSGPFIMSIRLFIYLLLMPYRPSIRHLTWNFEHDHFDFSVISMLVSACQFRLGYVKCFKIESLEPSSTLQEPPQKVWSGDCYQIWYLKLLYRVFDLAWFGSVKIENDDLFGKWSFLCDLTLARARRFS